MKNHKLLKLITILTLALNLSSNLIAMEDNSDTSERPTSNDLGQALKGMRHQPLIYSDNLDASYNEWNEDDIKPQAITTKPGHSVTGKVIGNTDIRGTVELVTHAASDPKKQAALEENRRKWEEEQNAHNSNLPTDSDIGYSQELIDKDSSKKINPSDIKLTIDADGGIDIRVVKNQPTKIPSNTTFTTHTEEDKEKGTSDNSTPKNITKSEDIAVPQITINNSPNNEEEVNSPKDAGNKFGVKLRSTKNTLQTSTPKESQTPIKLNPLIIKKLNTLKKYLNSIQFNKEERKQLNEDLNEINSIIKDAEQKGILDDKMNNKFLKALESRETNLKKIYQEKLNKFEQEKALSNNRNAQEAAIEKNLADVQERLEQLKAQIPQIDEQAKLKNVNTTNIPLEPLQVNNSEVNNSVPLSNPINDNVIENNITSANNSNPQSDTNIESNVPNPTIEPSSSNNTDTNSNIPNRTFIELEPENPKSEIKSNIKKNIALGSGAVVIVGSAIAAGIYGIKKQFASIIKQQIKNNALDLSLFNCDELLKFKDMFDQETNEVAKEAILDKMALVICDKISLFKKTKRSFTHWLSQLNNLLNSKNKHFADAAA